MNRESLLYDTINLRHNSDFEKKISSDVFWVPTNRTGKSRFDINKIKELKENKPNDIREMKLNAYEALQLFHEKKFLESNDIKYSRILNFEYQYHKSGYDAFITNTGCCASSASWFNYFVSKTYEKNGYILYFRPNGSGHAMNYIYFNGYYYIFDMATQTKCNIDKVPIETGKIEDYLSAKYYTGVCYKTSDLENFTKYHSRIQRVGKRKFAYYYINSCNEIPPNFVNISNGKINIFTTKMYYKLIEPEMYSLSVCIDEKQMKYDDIKKIELKEN